MSLYPWQVLRALRNGFVHSGAVSMLNPCCCDVAARVLVSLTAAILLAAAPALGQITSFHAPRTSEQGQPANLFIEWMGNEAADGFQVDLPGGWSVDSVTVLQDGIRPVDAQIEPFDGVRYRITADEPMGGPHTMILHVRPNDGVTQHRVELTPLIRSGASYEPRWDLGLERSLRLVQASHEAGNHAISFGGEEARPMVLRRERTPDLSLHRSYEVSFWMQSVGLGEVVLSSWNGDDRRPYPVEVVVDPSGRLRAYRGQPGEHQSLGSSEPVADGAWHHVSLSNRPEDGWARLTIDGRTVDSLYAAPPPSISMQLPLVLGGRGEGVSPYFDGLRPFSGRADEVRVDPVDEDPLRLDFEEDVPDHLLERPAEGLQREPAALGALEDLDEFRAALEPEGVTLTWTAPESQAGAFHVERSYDGVSFDEIEVVPARRDGAYTVYDQRTSDRVVFYRIRRVFPSGADRLSSTLRVGLGAQGAPGAVLLGNFPNPFNATTTVKYEVLERSEIHLAVWDVSGQPVATLVDQTQNPGVYEARFEAGQLPSGAYFVHLRTPEGTESQKMILMK